MIRLVLGLWCLMVNAIVNNISVISCRSDLLVGETWVYPIEIHWQTLSHNAEYTLPRLELTASVVIGTDCIVFLIQLPYHHDHDGPVAYDKF